ncbi:MAG: 50S ribosomal protein L11 methyltransferase [Polyangiaceae bacterium]|nr:50S ribosomal protein L11 methyltransferase [Polyangiaceae bacterium]
MSELPTHTLRIDLEGRFIEPVAAVLFENGVVVLEERAGTLGYKLVAWANGEPHAKKLEEAARSVLGEASSKIGRESQAEFEITSAVPSETAKWTQQVEPVEMMPGVFVCPRGPLAPPKPDGLVIEVEAALAFGFGDHPTTQMAAASLNEYFTDHAGSMLDAGTGSGVLAVFAGLRGASDVLGIDIDPLSVASSRRSAELCGVADRCRFAFGSPERLSEQFDLVMANLDGPTLVLLCEGLYACCRPGGQFRLSGFNQTFCPEVQQAFTALGAIETGRRDDAPWVLLELKRPL